MLSFTIPQDPSTPDPNEDPSRPPPAEGPVDPPGPDPDEEAIDDPIYHDDLPEEEQEEPVPPT